MVGTLDLPDSLPKLATLSIGWIRTYYTKFHSKMNKCRLAFMPSNEPSSLASARCTSGTPVRLLDQNVIIWHKFKRPLFILE